MKDDTLAKEINTYLLRFGVELDGRPRFRVVWAPDEVEARTGEFEYKVGDLYLGTTIETRLVSKYNYLSDCYVLEELILGSAVAELPLSFNGTYEPLYTFESAAGVPLRLTMKIIEIVMHAKMHPRSATQIKSDLATANEARARRVKILDFDTLGNHSEMQTRIHFGESNFTKGARNR